MNIYDAIIIGAGPAGGQCARSLSKAGKKILLVEKAKSFATNNYSSGGAPMELMRDYNLPDSIVGTFWNKLSVYSSNDVYTWSSPLPRGVILDFMKLRAFLANDSINAGAQLLLDTAYLSHQDIDGITRVELKNHETNVISSLETKALVDASGVERKVLAGDAYDKSKAMTATAIEFLIEAPTHIYAKYANTLSFFLGLKWMPQGYAWIFPMEANQLKIGVVRYFPNEDLVPHIQNYRFYLDHMLQEHIGTTTPKILDRHGKTLTYTYGQKDPLFDNNTIATGDAISSLNPLACEGIRHAMFCGQATSKCILDKLNGNQMAYQHYKDDLGKYFGYKWIVSEMLMNKLYRQSDDDKIDLFLQSFKKLSLDQLLEIGFQYKPLSAAKFYLDYKASAAKLYLQKVFAK